MKKYLAPFVFAAALFGLAGCSTNPATGEQSFTAFMSPEEERRVGAEEHPKLVKAFGGEYDDAAMVKYVRKIGNDLAQYSEIKNLTYTFTVLDDDKVNAFALPGGYVYITRGLLAVAETESEIAGVLGHEIGHVTARHTAQRHSKATAANIGLVILGVLGSAAGVPSGVGDLASRGTGLYLKSFSREQELESDKLAVRYITKAGYDANGMSSFFHKLQAHTRLQAKIAGDPDNTDKFDFSATHPRTSERINQAIRIADKRNIKNGKVGRNDYFDAVDGMVFGDSRAQGVRRGRVFAHPELRIEFKVPPGFTLHNNPTQVLAKGSGDAAIIYDMLSGKKVRELRSLKRYVADVWSGRSAVRDLEQIKIDGMEAATGSFRTRLSAGVRDVRLMAIREGADKIHRLVFLTPPNVTERNSVGFRRMTYSFRRLNKAEADAIQPLRIRVVSVASGDTAKSISDGFPVEGFRLEWFNVLNGFAPGKALTPGLRIKVIDDH